MGLQLGVVTEKLGVVRKEGSVKLTWFKSLAHVCDTASRAK